MSAGTIFQRMRDAVVGIRDAGDDPDAIRAAARPLCGVRSVGDVTSLILALAVIIIPVMDCGKLKASRDEWEAEHFRDAADLIVAVDAVESDTQRVELLLATSVKVFADQAWAGRIMATLLRWAAQADLNSGGLVVHFADVFAEHSVQDGDVFDVVAEAQRIAAEAAEGGEQS